MPAYRYLAYDLMSRKKLADLPLSDVNYSDILNGAGAFSANLAVSDITTTHLIEDIDDGASDVLYGDDVLNWEILIDKNAIIAGINETVTQPRRTALFIEREGQIVWGGIIWRRTYSSSSRSYLLEGSQYWSIFHHRLITDTKKYVQKDQTSQVVGPLISYAQSKAGGGVGVTVNTPASGVLIDATHWYYEGKYVGQVIEEMTGSDKGFDFALVCSYDGNGNIVTQFETYYPTRGRKAYQDQHVFEYGRNVIDFLWPEDGWNTANSVLLIGAGEGPKMLRSSRSDTSQLGAYPLMQAALLYKDIAKQSALDRKTAAVLQMRKSDVVLPRITVKGGADPSVGSYIPGDEIHFRVAKSARDPRFPNGYDGIHRIAKIEVSVPDDQGDETVVLTFVEPEV